MKAKSSPMSLFPPVQFLSLAALLFSFVSAPPVRAQIQQAWVAHYNNGLTNGQHQALKMALGSDGDIYLCGFSQYASSNLDYAVLKYAPNGNLIWAARYGSNNALQARPSGFALGVGNNSLVTGNAGTVSIDPHGNQRWVAPYAGLAVACDTSSNSFVTGFGTNFNTVKLSPTGTNIWMATFVDVGPTVGEALAVDTNGNAYVSGSDIYQYYSDGLHTFADVGLLTTEFKANGATGWSTRGVGVYGPINVPDSVFVGTNLYLALQESLYPYNFAVVSYGSEGKQRWAATDPTSNTGSTPSQLQVDTSGNVIVAGQDAQYPPLPSYGVYKINPTGAYVWTNIYPMSWAGSSGATGVALDSLDNCYVTGFSPTTNTGNDIVTIAYDTNGKQLWLQRYDGPAHGDDEGNAIAVDNNGNVYVAGYDTPIGGGTEMVLIKYSPVTAKHEANGDFQLQAQGAANEPFDIQATTNLSSWIDLGDYDADTNGLLQFIDTNASQYPQRFYQAIPQ